MRRTFTLMIGAMAVAGVVFAQQPAPLPPIPAQPITPVGNSVPAAMAKPAAPIDRFIADLRTFPETTVQAVYSVRLGADWFAKMQQADGRFLSGYNPILSRVLDDDSDTRQATAAVALSRSAAFTGDAKLSAAASQAVLALFTLTKTDPADATMRVPAIAADRGNKVVFAALTALAVYELPAPDAKLLAKAEELCAFLRKQLKPDGSVVAGDQPDTAVPGLVCQAIMGSDKWATAQWKRDAVANAVAFYRPAFKQTPNAMLAGTLLPAVAELGLRTKSEGACGFAFEMADRLCDSQFTATDARNRAWVGGFKLAAGEPTAAGLPCAQAVASALHLAAQVPDATRFAKYRAATLEAMKFGRTLQLTADGTRQFERQYAARVLVGGACGGPSDGCPRLEPTADLLACQLRFLASGGEKGE